MGDRQAESFAIDELCDAARRIRVVELIESEMAKEATISPRGIRVALVRSSGRLPSAIKARAGRFRAAISKR